MKEVSIIFICLDNYHLFFERFYASAEQFFLPHNKDKKYYVFCEQEHEEFKKDNVVFCKVDKPMKTSYKNTEVPDITKIKLNKFHYIRQHWDKVKEGNYIFYFDADSVIKKEILRKDFVSKGKPLIGVLHGFSQIRVGAGKKGLRFESEPKSKAYVDPERYDVSEYFQSCLWGGTVDQVKDMTDKICEWIDHDESIGHRNKYNICDEIYVNKYFVERKKDLHILGPQYCNPGEGWSKKRGVKLSGRWGEAIISHECAAQFNTEKLLMKDEEGEQEEQAKHIKLNPSRILGWSRVINLHKANYEMLKGFRNNNPKAHLLISCYKGDDFQYMAERFDADYEFVNDSIFVKWKAGRRIAACGSVLKYFETITNACLKYRNKADWMVLLEDDVECFNAPQKIPSGASLLGPMGPGYKPELRKYLEPRAGEKYCWRYSGCGGSLLNMKDWIDAHEKLEENKWDEFCSMDKRLVYGGDIGVSFVLQNAGYGVDRWDEFTGHWNEKKENYTFAHGLKKYYGEKLTEKDLEDILSAKSSGHMHVKRGDKFNSIYVKN